MKKEFLELTNVTNKVRNPNYEAGSKVIRIPIPKPKQKGWQRIRDEKHNLVYIRRRWKKKVE